MPVLTSLTPDEVLLGLLASQPQHGYQLLDYFRDPDALGQVWNLSTSQLYAVLKRLEKQGFISGRQVQVVDAPARTEYSLTDAGLTYLYAWLNEPQPSSSVRRVRVEFLSRVYIARLLDQPVQPIIDRQKGACVEQRAMLIARHAQLQPGIGSLALQLIIDQLEIILNWLERCSTTLGDWNP